MSVINSLLAMLDEGQDNSLIRFGLANAYFHENQPEAALSHYENALGMDARYTAAWKMYAKTLELLMQYESAKKAYQTGIEVAEEKGDYIAAKEMRAALRRVKSQIG